MTPNGRAALVTGAGAGIGAAVAKALAQTNMPVVLGDLSEERAKEVERGITHAGGSALGVHLDVRVRESVRACVAAGLAAFGGFATICANAGVAFDPRPLDALSDEIVDELLTVNLRGVIETLRVALPHLCDGGCVVITSSMSGLLWDPNQAVYSATKIGLIGLTRSLCAELSPRRIRVNAVCPGLVDTPLARRVHGNALPQFAEKNPLGRIAQPEDIAEAVAFLASPAARHVNGVALPVDGGEALQARL